MFPGEAALRILAPPYNSFPGLKEAINVLRFLNEATEFLKLLRANAGSALANQDLVNSVAEREERIVRVIDSPQLGN